MNRLINKQVIHKNLGEGTIINAEDTDKGIFIAVEFPVANETKRFGFPVAIGKILSNDEELLAIANDIENAKKEAQKRAEEERKVQEVQKLKEQSERAVKNANDIINKIDWDTEFTSDASRIFKVHQGKTFEEELKGGYIWAPESGFHHHERMTEIHTGDIIFHFVNGALVALSEAVSDCLRYPQPSELYGHGWGHLGYRVELRYQKLSAPYSLNPHKLDIVEKRAGTYSSFDKNAGACQGYLFDLEYDLAKLFKGGILATAQPTGVLNILSRIK